MLLNIRKTAASNRGLRLSKISITQRNATTGSVALSNRRV